MRLAGTARPEQDDVLRSLDEGEARELLDLGLGYAAGELEVVVLERLDRRQGRELEQRLSGSFMAPVKLGLQDALQEVGEADFLAGTGLGNGRIGVGQVAELQLLAHLGEPLFLQPHEETTRSS